VQNVVRVNNYIFVILFNIFENIKTRESRKPNRVGTTKNYKTMNILKIVNGKLELRKPNGALIRILQSSGVINADIRTDGSLIAITTDKGQVVLRKESGTLVRTISSSNCTNAKFSGNDILVTKSNGKLELRKESGTLIRTM